MKLDPSANNKWPAAKLATNLTPSESGLTINPSVSISIKGKMRREGEL